MFVDPGRVNPSVTTPPALRAAVVVTSNPHQRLLDGIMDARDVDVVFVESAAGAYSTVRRVRPGLVVVCLSFDDPLGFQVLSMSHPASAGFPASRLQSSVRPDFGRMTSARPQKSG